MNNEEKLKEAKRLYQTANSDQRYVLESLFPELKESEDERIRKELIRFHKSTIDVDGIKGEDILAWLEKQKSVGEIVERCKKSWYNEGKIRGQIEGLTDDEKYQQGWHDALEKQGKQKASYATIVETGNGGVNALVTKELPTNGCDDEQKSADEVLKIRQEVYQSGYNDGYKHGIEDVKQGEQTINQPDFGIPFGAKDSELIEESYYIPKGYHAEISKDKVTIKNGEQKPNSQNAQDLIEKYVSDHADCRWLDASELEQLLNDFVLEYDEIKNREYEQQCKCKSK